MRRKSLDYHFHPLISQHDVRAPDLSLPIKTLSSTAIRKITNEQPMAISYSQISRLGSQEIWKRDMTSQKGGGGGVGLYLDLSETTLFTSIEMRKTMLMYPQKPARR